MPQTEEHLQILLYLGVTRAVIALTKMDLAPGQEDVLTATVREQMGSTPLAEAPIVPTSVATGQGLEELKEALRNVLEQTPTPRDIGKPRLAVDRAFTLRGIGTIVTGTLAGGSFRQGDAVIIQPAGLATRIRSIQSHNRSIQVATTGLRTALNLTDVAVPSKATPRPGQPVVRRGQVITLPTLGEPSDTLDVLLERSARLSHAGISANRSIEDGATIRIHHGSTSVSARLILARREEIGVGERAVAQLRLDSPLLAFLGDRFIIRDVAERTTLAGGVVLNPAADHRHFRRPHRQRFLKQRARSWQDVIVCVETQVHHVGAARCGQLLVQSCFSQSEVADAVSRLGKSAKLVLAGDFVVEPEFWQFLIHRAVWTIDGWHRTHPEEVGLPLNQLRGSVQSPSVSPELCNALMAELGRNGFLITGTVIKRINHRPTLPPALETAGARLRAALAARSFDPPSRQSLAPDGISQQALRFLITTGEAVELNNDVVLAAEAFVEMKSIVVRFLGAHGPATVSDLRQAAGTSRRVMVPFLERLDRDGITQRERDRRSLRKQPDAEQNSPGPD